MKVFLIISLILLSIISPACSKDCAPSNSPVCSETAPTNEACLAVFQRWFYNAATQQCEQISYSGCSQKGFATQTECESCICNTSK